MSAARVVSPVLRTGNLKAMVKYVDRYGGHLEVWFRSPKHPAGATRLTEEINRQLNKLVKENKAKVEYFP